MTTTAQLLSMASWQNKKDYYSHVAPIQKPYNTTVKARVVLNFKTVTEW